MLDRAGRISNAPHQCFHRQPSRFIEMLANGGQVSVFSKVDIIEADDSQLFRDFDIHFAGYFQNTEGLHIGCGEDGGLDVRCGARRDLRLWPG